MAASTEAVRAVLDRELAGVDDPVLEYLSALIAEEDGGPTRPLQDEVAPFLMSAGIDGVDDEDAANALCDRLEAVFKAEFGGGAAPSAPAAVAGASGGTLLNAPLNIGEAMHVDKLAFGDVHGMASDKRTLHNDMWEAKDLGSKKKERKALRQLQRKFRQLQEDVPQAMGQLTRMLLPCYDGGSGVRDIQVDNVTLYTPTGSCLVEDAKLRLTYGRRYGLIGKNGIGKTTLLKAMANQEIDGFPKHLRCLHVSQECGTSEMSVVAAVMEADTELQMLLAEEKEIMDLLEEQGDAAKDSEDASRLAEVHQRLEEIDAATADARARALLSGLQFSPEMQAAPLSSMSGGWRVRAAIAAALFIKPEVLMLDEPTNHLDLEAVLWLQDHLQTYPHTVLVVSHDRSFLNEVVTDILFIESKKIKPYKGDFTTFEKVKKEALKNQIKEYERYKAERAHMQEFVDSFRYNAKRASLVQSRIKAIEKLDSEAPPEPVDAVPFTFSIPSPDSAPGRALIQLENAGFTYPPVVEGGPTRPIFSGVDFNVDSGERIGMVGPNGAGKSTLLKLALGELFTTEGTCMRKPGVTVASFTQHHADKIDLMLSPIENLMAAFPMTLEADARSHIGGYGISGAMQSTPCMNMSGGQKSRVAFALLAFAKPTLIVMDEPTNHLDIETIDALVEALRAYTGGVIAVSHDQHFIESVCSSLWVVGGGRVQKFAKGEFAEYKKEVIKSIKK